MSIFDKNSVKIAPAMSIMAFAGKDSIVPSSEVLTTKSGTFCMHSLDPNSIWCGESFFSLLTIF